MDRSRAVYLTLYVDDMKLIGPNENELDRVSQQIAEHFQIKDLGHTKHYLGMKVDQDPEKGTIRLSQEAYIRQLLAQCKMENSTPVATPMDPGFLNADIDGDGTGDDSPFDSEQYRSVIGSLQFLSTYTRPDIAFPAGYLARKNSALKLRHWKAVKHALRYLRGAMDLSIEFTSSGGLRLVAFSDADWAGDRSDRKSTTGTVIKIAGGLIFWRSAKQTGVALSTTEAEYIAVSETAKKLVAIRGILMELGVLPDDYKFPILVDNNGAIAASNGEKVTRNARHIDIRYHHVRDLVAKGVIDVLYTPSSKMTADGLTKPLPTDPFTHFVKELGLTR